MNEKRRDLYIPVKTLDSDDYIEGIGNLEVSVIAAGTVIAIIIGVVVSSVTQILIGLGVGVLIIMLVVGIIRRDSVNENLIQKVMIVHRYMKISKQYQYQYHNVLEFMDIENMQIEDEDWP